MAAGDPAQSQPPAAGSSVPLDRFYRVHRAGRIIAAGGRKQWRDSNLIPADQQDQKLSQSDALRQSPRDSGHRLLQLLERSQVRRWKSADHQIDAANVRGRENLHPRELAQPALQLVSFRRRLAVLRNHQAQPGKTQRGGGGADVEMLRPPSPPRLSHALKLGTGGDPLPPRITGPPTLQRTSKAV